MQVIAHCHTRAHTHTHTYIHLSKRADTQAYTRLTDAYSLTHTDHTGPTHAYTLYAITGLIGVASVFIMQKNEAQLLGATLPVELTMKLIRRLQDDEVDLEPSLSLSLLSLSPA